MTDTAIIAIPCRVITLNIEFGAAEGASTLEELVLRAVAGGRTTVEDLSRLFSLPKRLLLDVVHGLWSRGLLAVDFASNVLDSAQTAQSVLDEHDAAQLASTRMQSRQFLFDPVTGTVMPHQRGSAREPFGSIAMPLGRGASEKDIPEADLLRAVREVIRSERQHGMRQQVRSVSFANRMLSPPDTVRWKTVEVVVNHDPTTGMVTATPVDVPAGWSKRALHLFQARVRELVRDRPDSRFVQRLMSHQVLEQVPPDNLRSQMVGLGRLAKDLSTVEPDQLESRHEELRTKVDFVVEQLEEAERGRCSAQSVAAGSGVGWVVTHLIESAEHQLVMTLPWISYTALHPVLPALEHAAHRGVTLVFLWGDRQGSTLDGKVATALYGLQARFPDRVLLESRSSRCSASVVICDDKHAYVGSRSVFDDTGGGAGVLVGPADGATTPPACVADLLTWVKKVYPYWETAQRISSLPADFGKRHDTAAGAGPLAWRRRIEVPVLDETWREDEVGYRTKWSAAWGRLLRELVDGVEEVYRGAPVVRAAWDGMYVDLAQRVIAGAAERLAVVDDSAETEACGDGLGQLLLGLRDNGVTVHLQHPPFAPGSHPAKKYADLLRRLSTERTLRTTAGRARAVLCDHEVVVGSYRPLGSRSVNPVRGFASAEFGLHVTGTDFTAEFAGEMGIPDWFGGAGEVPDFLPPLPSLSSARTDDDVWTVLADRLAAGTPVGQLRLESAALLSASDDDGPEARKWGRWLLHDAWRRHAFVEAYLLAPRLDDGTEMPVELAAAAVPIEHGPFGDELYLSAAELAGAPPAQRSVVMMGAIAEMLLHGGETGLQVYEELVSPDNQLSDGLPPTWLRLVHAAAACFGAERVPLPLQDINAWAERQRQSAEIRSDWSRLLAELKDFERAEQHFNFVDGQRMHRGLFRSGGLLTRVVEMAQSDANAELRSRIAAELPRNARDARTHLDELTKELDLDRIHWSNHLTYARRVGDFTVEARRLAASVKIGEADRGHAAPPALVPGQKAFARFVKREWHTLLAESDNLGEPTCYPAKALLGAFASLPMAGEDGG